jgi:hypothetical protein
MVGSKQTLIVRFVVFCLDWGHCELAKNASHIITIWVRANSVWQFCYRLGRKPTVSIVRKEANFKEKCGNT